MSMASLYRRTGARPATALAMAQRDFTDIDPVAKVAVTGYRQKAGGTRNAAGELGRARHA
jgi:hypothetical protein